MNHSTLEPQRDALPEGATCLIIGGRGFVGSAISAVAERAGWIVTVAGRENYERLRGLSYDLVINANGNASRVRAEREPLFDFEASVRSVYRSIFDFRYRHYVLISTVDVYNDTTREESTRPDAAIDPLALGPYGFHKRLAELAVMRYCPRWQVYRLAQMVGHNASKGPVFDLLHGLPIWIDLDSCLPFIDTRTVGEAVIHLTRCAPSNASYNISGRGSVVFREVVNMLPPHLRSPPQAGHHRNEYRIYTDHTHQFFALPDSWKQVRQFMQEALGSKGPLGSP